MHPTIENLVRLFAVGSVMFSCGCASHLAAPGPKVSARLERGTFTSMLGSRAKPIGSETKNSAATNAAKSGNTSSFAGDISPVAYLVGAGNQEPKSIIDSTVLDDGSFDSSLASPNFGLRSPDSRQNLPPSGPLTLESLESLALGNSPAIRRASAAVESLRGKWLQAGLNTNPTVGIAAAEIGGDGRAGQQGVYFGREIVRGGKLELSRNTACREIEIAEQDLEIIRRRLLTDVRQAFYQLLILQQRQSIIVRFQQLNRKTEAAANRLFEAQEISKIAKMQAGLQTQNTDVLLGQVQAQVDAAKNQLMSVLNLNADEAESLVLVGDTQPMLGGIDRDTTLLGILNESAELVRANMRLSREQANLRRQQSEQVSNVTWQASLQHDYSTDDEIVGFQVGLPWQINNRNQGNIRAAHSQIHFASEGIDVVELDLRQRFAKVWGQFSNADARLTQISENVLPTNREIYELVTKAFQAGEAGYLDLITAQQNYLNASLQENAALGEYWQAAMLLNGQLLAGATQD